MRYLRRVLALGAISALVIAVLAACGGIEPTPTTPTPTVLSENDEARQPGAAQEEFDAEAYFRGRTITFITSSGLDGGTGVQLQYLADAISRFLPGNPNTVIRSQQPHVAGINLLWNSPNDGYTIGYLSHDPMREESFSQAQYRTADFTFIGDVGVDVNVFMVKSDLGYTNVQDLIGANQRGGPQLVMAAQAPNPLDIENAVLGWMLMAEWLDFPLRINAVAETATSQQILDIERGNQNTNEWGGGAWFLIGDSHPQWWTDGIMTIMFNRGMTDPVPTNSGVEAAMAAGVPVNWPPPHLFDLITPEQAEMFRGMVHSTENLDRPILGPPGMNENVRQALIRAFEAAFNDAQFCEGWTRITGAPCIWNDPDDAKAEVEAAYPAIERWASEVEATKQELFPKYFGR